MKQEKQKKHRRLETVRVSGATYRHLCDMAYMSGLKYPGAVVDKLVRNLRIDMSEARYEARRKQWESS